MKRTWSSNPLAVIVDDRIDVRPTLSWASLDLVADACVSHSCASLGAPAVAMQLPCCIM